MMKAYPMLWYVVNLFNINSCKISFILNTAVLVLQFFIQYLLDSHITYWSHSKTLKQ